MKNLTQEAEREAEKRRYEENRELERKREHEKQLESLRAVAALPTKSSRLLAGLWRGSFPNRGAID